ncbi:MAG: MFS transporter [Chloroflexi bacterium]|nr:MFS transporter [Chloroflexota bacterium]
MAQQSQILDGPSAAADLSSRRRRPLANRNFRLLWMGENVSLLGDQFYLIVLPTLVFHMTESSLAFGAVLLAAGLPRALLMIIGGVMTDRISPRRVMIRSNLARLAITALLTLLVAAEAVQLWMLFLAAFCFGLVDAFFHPAYRAMMPLIVEEQDLQTSNAFMQGSAQIVNMAGPGVAGVIIARLGTVVALTLDTFSFLFTSAALFCMHPPSMERPPTAARVETGAVTEPVKGRLLSEIGEVFTYIRQDRLLTILIGVVAAINLFFTGPLVVGSAALSHVRFEAGSAGFGAMLSSFSVGILIGTVSAGVARLKQPGLISLLGVASQGLFMVGIGLSGSLELACILWLIVGCTAGFGSLNFITLTQKRVNRAMMGRFMSLIALAEVGLAPISNAVAGVVADLNLTALFIGAGALLTTVALVGVSNRIVRTGEV